MKKTQFKTDIHQIFLLTKRNFSDWDKNPRIWMTFALGFVLCLMLTNQILEQAQTFQTPVYQFVLIFLIQFPSAIHRNDFI